VAAFNDRNFSVKNDHNHKVCTQNVQCKGNAIDVSNSGGFLISITQTQIATVAECYAAVVYEDRM
jgi:hypothetical protein